MSRRRFGWLEFVVGILMILLGIYTIIRPGNMLTGVIRIYAIAAIISGIRDIIFFCETEHYTGFRPAVSLVAGIVGLLAGVMLLAYPNAGKWILSLLVPIWFIAHSIFQLASLYCIKELTVKSRYYYVSLCLSILGLILGILLLIEPVILLVTSGIIVGVYLIITGINSLVIACSDLNF